MKCSRKPKRLISPKRRVSPHRQLFLTCIDSLVGFNCSEDENTAALSTLRKRSWIALRAKIEEQTAEQVLLGKLRGHFEEQFRYDEEGTPRVWKPEDDIDGAFKKAKEQVRSGPCVGLSTF